MMFDAAAAGDERCGSDFCARSDERWSYDTSRRMDRRALSNPHTRADFAARRPERETKVECISGEATKVSRR
jgi:hypothetical protein